MKLGWLKSVRLMGLAVVAMPLCYQTASATSKPDVPLQSALAEKEVQGFDAVRAVDNLDFGSYKTFLVQPPALEFDKHWLREFKRDMSDRDEERIRESYTQALQKALEDTLAKKLGWQKVAQAGADTLVIAPSLTSFRITAPDLSFRPMTKDFVEHAGSARLSLALTDGESGASLVELSDYSQTRSFGGIGELKQTNRAENLRDFKMLSKRWAARFAEFLANSSTPTP